MLFFIFSLSYLNWLSQYHLNTSHVILYPIADTAFDGALAEFKYISCYSLSYGHGGDQVADLIFKYISCYSLSRHYRRGHEPVRKFKYISCYSLSRMVNNGSRKSDIFKYISCYSLSNAAVSSWNVH